MRKSAAAFLPVLFCIASLGCSPVEDPTLFPEFDPMLAEPPPVKESVQHNPNRQLLWGDLHIHTSYSTDAYTLGVKATPDDAYIFARGGTIEHASGYPIRIDRPLDFAAVTDHSEYMGVARADGNTTLALEVRSLRERLLEDGPLAVAYAFATVVKNVSGLGLYSDSPEVRKTTRSAWQLMIDTAEAHYEPGVFTTLVGYEWTSMPDGKNLHRNVIYRDTNVPDLPYTSLESYDPADLWDALDQQRDEGMVMMAIPHNSNVSNGLMYDRVQYDGTPVTRGYSEQRLRNEPVSEILQIKGASETHPMLSPEDEFADFEIFSAQLSFTGAVSEPRGSYARDALRAGIEFSHSEGFNPYRFGVIGSSDSHNASSSVDEGNHHGKLPMMDGTAGLRLGKSILLPEAFQRPRYWGAAGLAGVWAQENSRESIYDALARRETFATSGPRMTLRFFGGFDFGVEIMQEKDPLERAYAAGVPMGGVLSPPEKAPEIQDAIQVENQQPTFVLWAAKDPEGANLDRLQIIKGWVDGQGVSHERVYDVAWSKGRALDANGLLKPVGNTVDTANATYENTIGVSQLSAVWQDIDFDSQQEAFYYARVLEIPTPRWSTFDAMRLGVSPPEPAFIQERAISSAIWYQWNE